MAKRGVTCPSCGTALPNEARVCTACGTLVPSPRAAREEDPEEESSGRAGRSPGNPFATELNRRLARLAQWAEASEALGIDLPRLPPWAEEAATRSRTPEAWAEVVRGIERLAQRRIVEAFGHWEERTVARIARLEAYAVDSRLERSQVDDAVTAAGSGDLAQALVTFQQVDRVVTLKERHLDQAREELERLVSFLRDVSALGLGDGVEPTKVAEELERELRAGQLVKLKQRMRALHAQAVSRLSTSFAEQVGRFGDRLAAGGRTAARGDPEIRELAIAARAMVLGRPEEGVRRLRGLLENRGLGEGSSSGPAASPPEKTGSS